MIIIYNEINVKKININIFIIMDIRIVTHIILLCFVVLDFNLFINIYDKILFFMKISVSLHKGVIYF